MWIVDKQVGVFTHYLTNSGIFQPGIDKATKFVSEKMAQIMAQKYGGTVRQFKS